MSSSSDVVWVQWEGNNSKRHDGTVSGVHKDCVIHGDDDGDTKVSLGDKVEVQWGRGGRDWLGTVVALPQTGRRDVETAASATAACKHKQRPVADASAAKALAPLQKRQAKLDGARFCDDQSPERKDVHDVGARGMELYL